MRQHFFYTVHGDRHQVIFLLSDNFDVFIYCLYVNDLTVMKLQMFSVRLNKQEI
jgi:hypothetical protein